MVVPFGHRSTPAELGREGRGIVVPRADLSTRVGDEQWADEAATASFPVSMPDSPGSRAAAVVPWMVAALVDGPPGGHYRTTEPERSERRRPA